MIKFCFFNFTNFSIPIPITKWSISQNASRVMQLRGFLRVNPFYYYYYYYYYYFVALLIKASLPPSVSFTSRYPLTALYTLSTITRGSVLLRCATRARRRRKGKREGRERERIYRTRALPCCCRLFHGRPLPARKILYSSSWPSSTTAKAGDK